MGELAILVPVLGRPHRVKPHLDSIERCTPDARVVFIADPDDGEEIAAIQRERQGRPFTVEILLSAGSYARKINRGVMRTTEPLIFFGADDLEFLPRWFEEAKRWLRSGVEVVGVNDLLNRRRPFKATHFLVTREYADCPTIDGERGPLCELYAHNFVDDEFVAVAKKRRAYVYAEGVKVKHHHPMGGAEDDETYRRGRSTFQHDRRIFKRRMKLWT